jgi:hypothetical protein
MFLELFIVLFAQLASLFGTVGAFVVVISAAIIAGVVAVWFSRWLINDFFSMGSGKSFSQREREKAEIKKSRAKKKFENMDDATLDAWCDKHPKERDILKMFCERLLEKEDYAGYARHRERYLATENTKNLDELAIATHRLADLCLEKLRDPKKTREVLEGFVSRFPNTPQAQWMRERIQNTEIP